MIKLIGLNKTYNKNTDAEVRALREIDLTLGDSGLVIILGTSGSGKSTLLNVIGALDGFDSGDIVVDGKSLKSLSKAESADYRNLHVGFVFQENNLIESFSVEENIGIASELKGEKGERKVIDEILSDVGLRGYATRRVADMSGGQKQRVAIARALIKKPDVILADEPTGNLDSVTSGQIFSLLKEASEKRLVIVVTHDEASALKYGDRVIRMSDGEITEDSAPYMNENANDKQTGPAKKVKSLKFRKILRLGITPCKKHIIRLTVTVLLFAVSLTLFTVGYTAADTDKSGVEYEALKASGERVVFLGAKLSPEGDVGRDYVDTNISEAQASVIKSKLVGFDFDTLYNYDRTDSYALRLGGNMPVTSDDDKFHTAVPSGAVCLSEDKLEDYGIAFLSGALPKNENEVAIPLYMYGLFVSYGYYDANGAYYRIENYTDIVGKYLLVSAGGNTTYAQIVGVVDTGFDPGEYSALKSVPENLTVSESEKYADLQSELEYVQEYSYHNALFVSDQFIDKFMNERSVVATYRTEPWLGNGFEAQTVSVNAAPYSVAERNGYNTVKVKDFDTLQIDEIVLSKDNLVSRYCERYGVFSSDVMDSDLVEFLRSSPTLSIALSKESTDSFNAKDAKLYTVTGYIDDENNSAGIYFSNDAVNDLYKDESPYRSIFTCLSGNESRDRELVRVANSLDNDENYYFPIMWKYRGNLDMNEANLNVFRKIGFYGAMAFLVFTVLMITNFISMSINASRKEIGVLSALGARGLDIVRIYSVEALLIGILAFAVSVGVTFAATESINALLSGVYKLPLLNLTYKQILVASALSVVVSLVGVVLPLIMLLRKKPVEILKN